ncbi:HD domain-containing protein [Candidatus Woesearchaeota archaeon]|nr:HD domain-containing protein [Candidatus Woesearchaeota archaeon]
MNETQILEKTKAHVKALLKDETTGHDWWHTCRVWKNAVNIARAENNVDLFVLQLAALLHDVGDWKFARGDEESGPAQIKEWLQTQHVNTDVIEKVIEIISTIAFKGPAKRSVVKTNEAKILQDADRLDALGAIGIARAFASGQKFGQVLHEPSIKPRLKADPEEYKKQYTGEMKNTTVNHFYEKLLLLKDQMNTKRGRQIAEKKHQFMENYLKEFFNEWDD